MELKTYEDVVKLHATYADTFRKRIDELKDSLPKSADDLLKSKRAGVKEALAAAKAAERSRDSLLKRANAEIAQHQEDAARLTSEIAALEQRTADSKRTVKPKSPARPAKPK